MGLEIKQLPSIGMRKYNILLQYWILTAIQLIDHRYILYRYTPLICMINLFIFYSVTNVSETVVRSICSCSQIAYTI